MISYKLNQNIDATRLVNDIQKLIQRSVKPDKEYLLVVRVQEINYNDDAAIPKLTNELKS